MKRVVDEPPQSQALKREETVFETTFWVWQAVFVVSDMISGSSVFCMRQDYFLEEVKSQISTKTIIVSGAGEMRS